MKFLNPSRLSAFTLVEVTLALGVTAFCLIAIFGLLPVGLKSNQAAIEQTVANGILSSVEADLRSTPPAFPSVQSGTSQRFAIAIPSNPVSNTPTPVSLYFSADGQYKTSLQTDSRYLLTVTFQPNGGSSKTATFVNLKVSWPAAAATALNAAGSVQTFIALDRN